MKSLSQLVSIGFTRAKARYRGDRPGERFSASQIGRHIDAWNEPGSSAYPHGGRSFEAGIRDLIIGWGEYADAYRAHHDSPITDDGVLGPAWEQIGHSIREMLTGELGRFDGGTLDSLIVSIAEEHGLQF
jgi:hypothetical protein